VKSAIYHRQNSQFLLLVVVAVNYIYWHANIYSFCTITKLMVDPQLEENEHAFKSHSVCKQPVIERLLIILIETDSPV
jgi:hypothetical protein